MDETHIFAVRTAANREDQVADFLNSKITRETKLEVYAVVRPHGMRGYIFMEAGSRRASCPGKVTIGQPR